MLSIVRVVSAGCPGGYRFRIGSRNWVRSFLRAGFHIAVTRFYRIARRVVNLAPRSTLRIVNGLV